MILDPGVHGLVDLPIEGICSVLRKNFNDICKNALRYIQYPVVQKEILFGRLRGIAGQHLFRADARIADVFRHIGAGKSQPKTGNLDFAFTDGGRKDILAAGKERVGIGYRPEKQILLCPQFFALAVGQYGYPVA